MNQPSPGVSATEPLHSPGKLGEQRKKANIPLSFHSAIFHRGCIISKEGISLFLPAYNEEENVEYMVSSARDILEKLAGDHWEVIVVDDGSTDATADLVSAMSQTEPRIRLASHGRNKGFGSAVRTGILASRMPWIFYTDCDGQFDLDELALVWEMRHSADIVSGYRRRRRDPGMRLVYSLLWNTLTVMMFIRGFKDVDCSFKLYRASIFECIHPVSTCGVIDFEILTLARDSGFTVAQIPVTHYPRRAGTVSFESVRTGFVAWVRLGPIFEMFRQLVAFRIRTWMGDMN